MRTLLKERRPCALCILSFVIIATGIVSGSKAVPEGHCCPEPPSSQTSLCMSEGNGVIKLHFLNVGDAEAILIQQENAVMLIDAGNEKDSTVVKQYLKRQEIGKIDVLVGTHIHEDHIGSLDDIIRNFDIGKIYMPDFEISNKYLEDVRTAADRKGLSFSEPISGENFKLGGATCTILAPISRGYEKLNDYSIVIKLQFEKTSFLLTGDAESTSEREMMRRGYDLSADVLKLGHHGSISSTGREFLERVNPKYAVLCTDKENKYKHPHLSTMKKLKARNIKVYRTDEAGTIVVTSDGEKISFNVPHGSYNGK
ncbi:MAG: ComEC/Rec2 family competence protein [Bacillota bacterium]|nr:ComEC/Rec2 family competence protein [Bacillota bacterium]